MDFGFWVLGFGFWVLGFGFWVAPEAHEGPWRPALEGSGEARPACEALKGSGLEVPGGPWRPEVSGAPEALEPLEPL